MRVPKGIELAITLKGFVDTFGPVEGLKAFAEGTKGQIRINDIFVLALAIVFATALVGTVATNTDQAQTDLANYTSAQNIAELLPFLYIAIPVLAIVALF